MLPTRIVRPSGENAAPCDQWPIGASATLLSLPPLTRSRTRLPWSLKNGDCLGLLLPFIAMIATSEPSGESLMPSGV